MSMLKAGTYKMYIYVNNKEMQSSPFSIEVQPSLIDADKCLSVPLSSYTVNSGETITIQYQCRVMYGNNIQNL